MRLFQALYAKDFVILCQESVCRCALENLLWMVICNAFIATQE